MDGHGCAQRKRERKIAIAYTHQKNADWSIKKIRSKVVNMAFQIHTKIEYYLGIALRKLLITCYPASSGFGGKLNLIGFDKVNVELQVANKSKHQPVKAQKAFKMNCALLAFTSHTPKPDYWTSIWPENIRWYFTITKRQIVVVWLFCFSLTSNQVILWHFTNLMFMIPLRLSPNRTEQSVKRFFFLSFQFTQWRHSQWRKIRDTHTQHRKNR